MEKYAGQGTPTHICSCTVAHAFPQCFWMILRPLGIKSTRRVSGQHINKIFFLLRILHTAKKVNKWEKENDSIPISICHLKDNWEMFLSCKQTLVYDKWLTNASFWFTSLCWEGPPLIRYWFLLVLLDSNSLRRGLDPFQVDRFVPHVFLVSFRCVALQNLQAYFLLSDRLILQVWQ